MDISSSRGTFLFDEEMASSRDWRKALRSQPAYRIVNKTIRGQTQFITIVSLAGLIIIIILYMMPRKESGSILRSRSSEYNYTYPLTRPQRTASLHTFRIGIIADLDTNSLSSDEKYTWYSYLKTGYLRYDPVRHSVTVEWDKKDPEKLKAQYALKNRGMELSELVVFNGKLLTFDDRTGIVYEIVNNKVVPWTLLMDGDGRTSKGFKSEWATVKDEVLFVGSMGKEWTTSTGKFVSNDPQYVKAVTVKGQVSHLNWRDEYAKLRRVLGIEWPGYMIHESGVWSSDRKRWFFLPRRCSKEPYDEKKDERNGCSVLLSATENFDDVQVVKLPNGMETRGFSSFKFIPTSNDYVFFALKTEELDGKTATYVTAFTIEGELVMKDQYVSDLKYEGFEFI